MRSATSEVSATTATAPTAPTMTMRPASIRLGRPLARLAYWGR